ncbi:MAG: cyclic nucleotide-binding domain-containing protein [Legionella sp.]
MEKYAEKDLIIRQGEQGDAFYIVFAGSVCVFTHDQSGKKVKLARLNKGDYFGEQELLGQANKSRNANIEAVTDTNIIRIDEQFIIELLQIDKKLKLKLLQLGFDHVFQQLSLPTEFYNDIKSIALRIENPTLMELSVGTMIFAEGDKPDNVYIILQGNVELLIHNKTTKELNSLI